MLERINDRIEKRKILIAMEKSIYKSQQLLRSTDIQVRRKIREELAHLRSMPLHFDGLKYLHQRIKIFHFENSNFEEIYSKLS